jgi:hypothetical protein
MPDRPTPEPEIIITPEMLEAGCVQHARGDMRFEFPSEVVMRIYEAMRRVELAIPEGAPRVQANPLRLGYAPSAQD